MNPMIQAMAKEIAMQINKTINIPFLNEEQERLFFELVVTKVFELMMGYLLKHLDKKDIN
jgi:hypothetical protein